MSSNGHKKMKPIFQLDTIPPAHGIETEYGRKGYRFRAVRYKPNHLPFKAEAFGRWTVWFAKDELPAQLKWESLSSTL